MRPRPGRVQLNDLYARFRELGIDEPTADDEAYEVVMGAPTRAKVNDYRHRRKALLLAMLEEHADALDEAADEIGAFFDRLRQIGIRGLMAEKANDPELAVDPARARRAANRQA